MRVLTVVVSGSGTLVAGSGTWDQAGRNLEPPPGWQVHADEPGPARAVVVMRPGWLIRPGPAAVLWDPAWQASGTYSVSATLSLFPAGLGMPPSGVEAPYGLVVGGAHLASVRASAVLFLIRNDGRFRIERRSAARIEPIVDWTPHVRIARFTERSVGTARNHLHVQVGTSHVRFRINGAEAASVSRVVLPLTGTTVGLRVGDRLSVHVRDLRIEPAPASAVDGAGRWPQ